MAITIHRDDGNYGPYTLEQVNAMLASGQLAADDLAWQEGTTDWVPLANIPGVLRVPPPPPATRAAPSHRRQADESDRQILPAFLLAFFFGLFGIHRFYVGKTGSGIAMLVLTLTAVGTIVTFPWSVIDWIMIVSANFTDAEGKRLRQWT